MVRAGVKLPLDPVGGWRDGDLYVFVIDKTGRWKASGARPDHVGKNELNTPDANGKLFRQRVVSIDKNGWVDYKFRSPADNQVHDKSSYVVLFAFYFLDLAHQIKIAS